MRAGVAQLGDRIQEPITKFKGIVVSVIQYLQGCERVGVLSEDLDKDGKPQEWQHFDNVNLKIVKRGVHEVFEREIPVSARSGGPRPDAPSR